jgi:hypothetical protein
MIHPFQMHLSGDNKSHRYLFHQAAIKRKNEHCPAFYIISFWQEESFRVPKQRTAIIITTPSKKPGSSPTPSPPAGRKRTRRTNNQEEESPMSEDGTNDGSVPDGNTTSGGMFASLLNRG